MFKVIAHIISYCVYYISFLLPRSRKQLVFGGPGSAFSNNSKYLFIYCAENCPDLEICWLTRSHQTVAQVREMGFHAYWIYSPVGIWKALRAKFWFFNTYSAEIMFFLSGGATLVNLWHGVGLKRIEFAMAHEGPLADRYVRRTFKERFFNPQCFQRPAYFLSSTDFQSELFAHAFRIPLARCMNLGYPRNRILLESKENIYSFVEKYEPAQTKCLIEQIAAFDKVYIYMPTWRDSQQDIFVQNMDLERLSSVLRLQNAVLMLKPHPMTRVDNINQFDNIILVDSAVDIYPVLPFTDVLITDYSSILYDYLLMPQKQVILYLYDYADYVNDRGFYYPFDENVVGKRVDTFDGLLATIEKQDYVMDNSERKRILNKFWADTMQQDVCANILRQTHVIS